MWEALIKLVEKWSCCHKWESHHTTKVYENSFDNIPWKNRGNFNLSKMC